MIIKGENSFSHPKILIFFVLSFRLLINEGWFFLFFPKITYFIVSSIQIWVSPSIKSYFPPDIYEFLFDFSLIFYVFIVDLLRYVFVRCFLCEQFRRQRCFDQTKKSHQIPARLSIS